MQADTVLILGSAPQAVAVSDWDLSGFSAVIAINNAWRIDPRWTHWIRPEDFPPENGPDGPSDGQHHIGADDYVPVQNQFGGFVYAGGTMAFTAGYWALGALRPRVMTFFGCDMVYPSSGQTHFYGTGAADPLRADPSLRNLEAKAARLEILAARNGCACVNLSDAESRLVFQRGTVAMSAPVPPRSFDQTQLDQLLAEEDTLGYRVASGRYWEVAESFDTARIDALDTRWLALHAQAAEGA